MEKIESSLIMEAGVQSNNAQWSETLIGKLFNWTFRVISLDGFLTDRFKDLIGAKSFIIKNLARRLEKTIDKLPGEYVQRNEDLDFQNLEMQFYDELLKLINIMNGSKDIPIGKIYDDINKTIDVIDQIVIELNPKDVEQSKLLEIIKAKQKVLIEIQTKVKTNMNTLTDTEANEKTGYNLSKFSDLIGDKNDIKRKVDTSKAKLINTIKTEKDGAKISTESMFKIISILNKARNLYMEEDREGETVYRGNKRETVFNPNRRLFSLWEKKVLDILSRKSSIIPKTLLAYINNSLASVDPLKYNFEVEPGVEKNVLDQLSDIDRAMGSANKKFGKSRVLPTDIIPQGKSTATSLHLKAHERLTIKQDTLLRSMIDIQIGKGNLSLLNDRKDDTELQGFDGKSLIFVPTRTYVNGMVLGVLSFSPTVFDKAPTSGKAIINIKELEFDGDFWRKDPHYYWGVINSKDLTVNGNYLMKIFNPGTTYTNKGLMKLDDEMMIETVIVNKLERLNALYGNDDKIVEVDKKYLEKKFNFNSTGYRSIDQYFNSNKF